MKNMIVVGVIVLMAALLATPAAAQAQFNYTTNNGAITITGYTGSGGAVTIPAQITDLPVTGIGDWAFYFTGVINVTIADTVTNIGDGAFFDCASLTNVTIGDHLASIGDWAFGFCSRLTNVNFRGNAPGLGDTNVFYGDSATVNYLPATAGWGPTLGGLVAVLWNPPVPYNYTTNNNTITITGYTGPGGAVVIPSTINFLRVTSIGTNAFANLSSITNVSIPSSVAGIASNAFFNCEHLTSVAIPNSVTSMGESAFAQCFSLTNATIGDGVTSIAARAFFWCSWLPSIALPGGVTNIGDSAFQWCYRLTNATLPNGLLCLGDAAFSGTSLNSVIIPSSVTNIGDSAFEDCTEMTEVTIPACVASLGDSAFAGCHALTNLTIPTNLTSIGNSVFAYCYVLSNVTIPGSVTSLGDSAFFGCFALSNVTIPASVTYFAADALEGCMHSTNIYFQGNAPTIGSPNGPFLGAPLMGTVYYLPGTTGWSNSFDRCPAVLWNPLIQTGDGSFGVQNNQFGFNITGTTNIPIVVEASTGLASPVWTPLQSLTLTNGSYYFSEPFQPGSSQRYYRISSQ